ncbi:MAG TPA: CHRD domain-containing protein [Methylibium sp.]|nr:CHRD domain-containing protein [Methylibium sp.]
MRKPLSLSSITATGLFALAAWAPPALAGHTNIVLEARLDGREEVRADVSTRALVGDPDGYGEAYVFGIDGDPFTLCYVLTVHKLAELDLPPGAPRMAHIHEGARGSNGPVVANLAWPQGGQAGDCLTEGEGAGTAGVKFPSGESGIVQRILNNPNGFYINVHNGAYPAGAVRGQLSDTASH